MIVNDTAIDVTFERLAKKWGDIEAMRVLEVLEDWADAERRRGHLMLTPSDRFRETLAYLVESKFAA